MALTRSPLSALSLEDDERLARCWQLQTCASCLTNELGARCGWCPYSMTCVPLPRTLFSPVFIPLSQNFCPLRTERFDLRTHSFGRNSCQVSTLTFLGVLLGIICTVLAIPLFWFIWKLLKALWYGLASNYGGWEIVGEDVANGFVERENIWFREGAWSKLWRNQDEHHLPINQSDEQLRGWFGTKRKPSRKEDERRALLDQ